MTDSAIQESSKLFHVKSVWEKEIRHFHTVCFQLLAPWWSCNLYFGMKIVLKRLILHGFYKFWFGFHTTLWKGETTNDEWERGRILTGTKNCTNSCKVIKVKTFCMTFLIHQNEIFIFVQFWNICRIVLEFIDMKIFEYLYFWKSFIKTCFSTN